MDSTLIFAPSPLSFHMKFTPSLLIKLERHLIYVEILDVSYKWDQFEPQLTLRDAVFFSLGTLRISFTLEEFYELFNVFSAIRPQYLKYSNISKQRLWEYISKLARAGYIQLKNDPQSAITISLSEIGAKEADSLISNNTSQLVNDRLNSLREYFGISIPAL